jgi:hypothetical protein
MTTNTGPFGNGATIIETFGAYLAAGLLTGTSLPTGATGPLPTH